MGVAYKQELLKMAIKENAKPPTVQLPKLRTQNDISYHAYADVAEEILSSSDQESDGEELFPYNASY